MAIYTFSTNERLKKALLNSYATNAGLVFVKQSTATSGSTLSIDDCFNTNYDTYLVSVANLKASTTANMTARLRVSSTDNSSSVYWYSGFGVNYTGAAAITYYPTNPTSGASSWRMPSSGTNYGGFMFTVYDPFRAVTTGYSLNSATGNTGTESYSGFHDSASSFTGMSLILSTGTFTNVKVTVYGYRKA